MVKEQSANGYVGILWQVKKHFKRTEQNPGGIVTMEAVPLHTLSQIYSSWILWIGEKAFLSSATRVQQGEEAVNRNFLSLEDLQGFQSKSRTSQSYLQVLGGWWHQSPRVGGNASGSIVIPYRVILREMKTTSRVEGLLANLACQCFCLLLRLHTGGGFELVSVSIYQYARKIIYLSECAISFFLLLIWTEESEGFISFRFI